MVNKTGKLSVFSGKAEEVKFSVFTKKVLNHTSGKFHKIPTMHRGFVKISIFHKLTVFDALYKELCNRWGSDTPWELALLRGMTSGFSCTPQSTIPSGPDLGFHRTVT